MIKTPGEEESTEIGFQGAVMPVPTQEAQPLIGPNGHAVTLLVDGLERPTLNSQGQLIHPDLEGLANFWRWFSDSDVTDQEGRPLVLFHGTNAEFNAFDHSRSREDDRIFMTPAARMASDFALYRTTWTGANVMPIYVKASLMEVDGDFQNIRDVENTFSAPDMPENETVYGYAQSKGYQGVKFKKVNDPVGPDYIGSEDIFSFFKGAEYKSALGNNGQFDAMNTDIRQSKTTASHAIGVNAMDLKKSLARAIPPKYAQKIHVIQSLEDLSIRHRQVVQSRAFHGTHKAGITQFSTEHMGTGEGVQAFGWGLYFAGDREIAAYYRETLKRRASIRERGRNDYEVLDPDGAVLASGVLYGKANRIKEEFDNDAGHLYEVSIPDQGDMLTWEKAISLQSETIKRGLSNLPREIKNKVLQNDYLGNEPTGSLIYNRLQEYYAMGRQNDAFANKADYGAKEASLELLDVGIKGIKYLDGKSRTEEAGSYNYVIFDGADVTQITPLFSKIDGNTEGVYDLLTGEVILIADQIKSLSRGVWVAWHELYHRGLDVYHRNDMRDALVRYGRLPLVQHIADRIALERKDDNLPRSVLIEEALAELGAAVETGNFSAFKERYRAIIPNEMKSGLAALCRRFFKRVAGIWAKVTGDNEPTYTELFDYLRGVRAVIAEDKQNPVSNTAGNGLRLSRARPEVEAIIIDGIKRPTTTSEGQLIHYSMEGIENFWRWYGDSQVVDTVGRPIVAYRGVTTSADDQLIPTDFFGSNLFGRGINLTSAKDDANKYASTDMYVNHDLIGNASIMSEKLEIPYQDAKDVLTAGGGMVMPLFVKLLNPLHVGASKLIVKDSVLRLALAEIQYKGNVEKFIDKFQSSDSGNSQYQYALENRATQLFRQIATLENRDGLVIDSSVSPRGGGATHWLAFDSSQIKSAIGNSGKFDAESYELTDSSNSKVVNKPGSNHVNEIKQLLKGAALMSTNIISIEDFLKKKSDIADAKESTLELNNTSLKFVEYIAAYSFIENIKPSLNDISNRHAVAFLEGKFSEILDSLPAGFTIDEDRFYRDVEKNRYQDITRSYIATLAPKGTDYFRKGGIADTYSEFMNKYYQTYALEKNSPVMFGEGSLGVKIAYGNFHMHRQGLRAGLTAYAMVLQFPNEQQEKLMRLTDKGFDDFSYADIQTIQFTLRDINKHLIENSSNDQQIQFLYNAINGIEGLMQALHNYLPSSNLEQSLGKIKDDYEKIYSDKIYNIDNVEITEKLKEDFRLSNSASSFLTQLSADLNIDYHAAQRVQERVEAEIAKDHENAWVNSEKYQLKLKLTEKIQAEMGHLNLYFPENTYQNQDVVAKIVMGVGEDSSASYISIHFTDRLFADKHGHGITVSLYKPQPKMAYYTNSIHEHVNFTQFTEKDIPAVLNQTQIYYNQIYTGMDWKAVSKFVEGRAETENRDYAEKIRADIKLAVEKGILPSDLRITVRERHHGYYALTIAKLPESMPIRGEGYYQYSQENRHYSSHDNDFNSPLIHSPVYKDLERAIECIADIGRYCYDDGYGSDYGAKHNFNVDIGIKDSLEDADKDTKGNDSFKLDSRHFDADTAAGLDCWILKVEPGKKVKGSDITSIYDRIHNKLRFMSGMKMSELLDDTNSIEQVCTYYQNLLQIERYGYPQKEEVVQQFESALNATKQMITCWSGLKSVADFNKAICDYSEGGINNVKLGDSINLFNSYPVKYQIQMGEISSSTGHPLAVTHQLVIEKDGVQYSVWEQSVDPIQDKVSLDVLKNVTDENIKTAIAAANCKKYMPLRFSDYCSNQDQLEKIAKDSLAFIKEPNPFLNQLLDWEQSKFISKHQCLVGQMKFTELNWNAERSPITTLKTTEAGNTVLIEHNGKAFAIDSQGGLKEFHEDMQINATTLGSVKESKESDSDFDLYALRESITKSIAADGIIHDDRKLEKLRQVNMAIAELENSQSEDVLTAAQLEILSCGDYEGSDVFHFPTDVLGGFVVVRNESQYTLISKDGESHGVNGDNDIDRLKQIIEQAGIEYQRSKPSLTLH